jgi:hypothetical protein
MMTSGDIEFEPDLTRINDKSPSAKEFLAQNLAYNTNPKIFMATSSIVVMTAGDSGIQAEIMADAIVEINSRIKSEPNKWLDVKDAVESYLNAYNKAKAARVRDSVLTPLGLDPNTLISRQSEMTADFILETSRRIHRCEAEFRETHGVETIITGIDDKGPHIYTVFKRMGGDHVMCCDSIGFAAVGSGGRHAESQFMMAGHNPYANREETMLLTYMAKKRSEVAPGVGHETDMFVIGPKPGTVAMMANIPDFDMKEIASIHKKMEEEQAKRFQAAKEKTKKYIAAMFAARAKKKAPEQSQQKPPESPPVSAESPPASASGA